jgi:hypothetical protein
VLEGCTFIKGTVDGLIAHGAEVTGNSEVVLFDVCPVGICKVDELDVLDGGGSQGIRPPSGRCCTTTRFPKTSALSTTGS